MVVLEKRFDEYRKILTQMVRTINPVLFSITHKMFIYQFLCQPILALHAIGSKDSDLGEISHRRKRSPHKFGSDTSQFAVIQVI